MRYLHRPLPRAGWESRIEELFLATPFVAAHALLDLAAEICFCLEIAGEGRSPELRELLALLAAHQQPDGRVVEPATRPRPPGDEARLDAHCTAAALLAFAATLG
jgi:uncharacterized protein DUF6895